MDTILNGIDRFYVCFHSNCITNKGTKAIEKLRLSVSSINSWCIRVDDISGNRFMSPVDTESGNGDLKSLVRWVIIDIYEYCVVVVNTHLILSIGCHIKCGMNYETSEKRGCM